MYVTDVPVIDRLTDPAVREIDTALALFEDMAADMYGAGDWVASSAEGLRECDDEYDGCHDLPRALEHLSRAIEAALAAQHAIRESLSLLNLPTL